MPIHWSIPPIGTKPVSSTAAPAALLCFQSSGDETHGASARHVRSHVDTPWLEALPAVEPGWKHISCQFPRYTAGRKGRTADRIVAAPSQPRSPSSGTCPHDDVSLLASGRRAGERAIPCWRVCHVEPKLLIRRAEGNG